MSFFFFLRKTVTIQLLGSMSLQRFLYKMKLSKQFVIELTFYSVFFLARRGMVLLELHNSNSLDWLHLNFIFLKRKILEFKFAI